MLRVAIALWSLRAWLRTTVADDGADVAEHELVESDKEGDAPVIAQGWSLATAYSLLAWYVFAPQCLSTLAVVRRETNSWKYPIIMAAYLFGLAYAAAFATFRLTQALGG